MRGLDEGLCVLARARRDLLAVCALLCTAGCTGPNEFMLGNAESLLESERAVIEIQPSNYRLRVGFYAGSWNGTLYTARFTRWDEQELSGECFSLTVPPGCQRIEVCNTWSNGWNETLVVEFEAGPGVSYDVWVSQVIPDERGPGPTVGEMAGLTLLSAALWPLTPILAVTGVAHSRPEGVTCRVWVARRCEDNSVADLAVVPAR